jgi:cytosine/adenosine deaminase-related metal-dependent hydrolase
VAAYIDTFDNHFRELDERDIDVPKAQRIRAAHLPRSNRWVVPGAPWPGVLLV